MTSPKNILRSPLPRGNCGGGGCLKKNSEQDASAVGLGIVAALEKSGGGGQGEIVAKFWVGSLNLNHNRSEPIPIGVGVGGGGDSSKPTATSRLRTSSVFCESPPSCAVGSSASLDINPAFPTPDFLSSCYLCRRNLHGRDIYMYRGEKAFCSTECRYQQIVKDESKEKCKAEASRPKDLSASSYTNTQLFSPGIIAA